MKFVAKKGSKYSDVASRIVNYLYDKDEYLHIQRQDRFSSRKIMAYKRAFFSETKKERHKGTCKIRSTIDVYTI